MAQRAVIDKYVKDQLGVSVTDVEKFMKNDLGIDDPEAYIRRRIRITKPNIELSSDSPAVKKWAAENGRGLITVVPAPRDTAKAAVSGKYPPMPQLMY